MADNKETPVENPDENVMDFGKKKKKKDKLKNILKDDEEQTSTPASATTDDASKKLQELSLNQQQSVTSTTAATTTSTDATTTTVADGEEDFSKMKKKAKGTKTVKFGDDVEGVEFESTQETSGKVEAVNDSQSGWLGSERDYTYDELLERVFKIMREKNPDMVNGERKRFVMKPPHVARVGTKKTSFTNFGEICRLLKREEKHLLNFLLAELGTSGSLDINTQLIIKGRFSQKQIENVLRRYIKEYITCHTCRSPDTSLVKEERIFFLQCNACKSRCSVASIRSGFQAQVGKRAAQRAKTA